MINNPFTTSTGVTMTKTDPNAVLAALGATPTEFAPVPGEDKLDKLLQAMSEVSETEEFRSLLARRKSGDLSKDEFERQRVDLVREHYRRILSTS